LKTTMHEHTTRNRQQTFIASAALIALAITTGCHCTPPPRYHTTWRRITSAAFQPAHPYCHGYTHTQWSRWPDECNQHEFIIAEEVPLPLPPPPTVAPAPAQLPVPPSPEQRELFDDPTLPVAPPMPDDMPPLEEEASPDRLIIPQGYTPEAQKSASDNAPPPTSTLNWSARAKRFLGEVTTFR
jgi:hypothetical protein